MTGRVGRLAAQLGRAYLHGFLSKNRISKHLNVYMSMYFLLNWCIYMINDLWG